MKIVRFAVSSIAATAVAVAMVVVPVAPALAATSFQISWTKIGIYPRVAPDMNAAHAGAAIPDGTWISVECETTGTYERSDVAYTNIWERLANGTYIPNAFVETGANGWTPGVPNCSTLTAAPVNPPPVTNPAPTPVQPTVTPQPVAPQPVAPPVNPQPIQPVPTIPTTPETPVVPAGSYDRAAAVDWAHNHYEDANLKYMPNCTVFASGVLFAGGLPITDSWQPSSMNPFDQGSGEYYAKNWFHGPTKRWSSIDFLKNYIVNEKKIGTITELSGTDRSAGGAQLGDLIGYDWGSEDDPGILDHVAVVTGVDGDGNVVVTQKQDDQVDRVWYWSQNQNDTIDNVDPGTRYYLIHVTY